LPPLESLTEESDFAPFMRPPYRSELRRQALRKMFRNPKYGVVDDLDPYRADFAAFTPLGDIVTSDMKFHAERLLRKQLEKAAEERSGWRARVRPGGCPGSGAGSDRSARRRTKTHRHNPTEDGDERRDG
jgi:hypothetical protein